MSINELNVQGELSVQGPEFFCLKNASLRLSFLVFRRMIFNKIISKPGFIWQHSNHFLKCSIISNLRKWQESNPIILLVIDKDTKIHFEYLVDSFCLSIHLRMICCGSFLIYSQFQH